jgi:hypothetical protein
MATLGDSPRGTCGGGPGNQPIVALVNPYPC